MNELDVDGLWNFAKDFKTNYVDSEKYIEIAKRDLKSSENNYKMENYAKSSADLQQSVEKIAKAWGLYWNQLKSPEDKDQDDLKDIKSDVGHNSPKAIFFTLITLLNKLGRIEGVIEHLDIEKDDVDDFEDLTEKILQKKQQIAKYNSSEIKDMIDVCNSIIHDIKDNKIDGIDEDMEKLIPGIKIWPIGAPISLLTVLTFPHSPRYPNDDPEPKKYLNKELAFVDFIPEIIQSTKYIIDIFETSLDKQHSDI